MRPAVVVLISGALLGAGSACGGGGGKSDTLRAKRNISAAAQGQAKSMLLKLSDFPNGWRASAAAKDAAGERKFRNCIGVDYSDLTIAGDATSKDFAIGDSTTANSEAQVFASPEQAGKGVRRFSQSMEGSGIRGCLKKFVAKETPSDYTLGEIQVGDLRFTAPAGLDAAKAWQVEIPFEPKSGSSGLSVSAFLDIVMLLKGVAVSQIQTTDAVTPLDPDLRDHLVQTVGGRMAAASG